MPLRIKLLSMIAVLTLGSLGWFDDLKIRIVCSLILFTVIAYLVRAVSVERKGRESRERQLRKLSTAYDELDEQAKIIVRTDLELTRTQEELDKKIDGLYALHELGKTLSTTFNMEELFNLITEPLIFKLGFEKCLIFFLEDETDRLVPKTGVGYSGEEIKEVESRVREFGLVDQVIKGAKSILASEMKETAEEEKKLAGLFRVSSFMMVPIVVKEKPHGFLFVGNELPYTKLSEGDLEILSILAGQLASSIENAMLYSEVWRSHRRLELNIKERTKELAQANEELKRLDKVKSDFISAVAHELRTPLTSIKGYAYILRDEKLGKVTPEQKERLTKIDKHSTGLAKLVNDLLDISRIESGKIEMKIVSLLIKDVIGEVMDIIAPQAESKEIKLTTELASEVSKIWADESQIVRAFLNILSNAIKFTPKKGEVTIRITAVDDHIQTDIIDTGIGIGKKDLANVFDEFYRVDNPINRAEKGTGLGLSLAKRVVEAHKGKIWVRSEVGKGTTVSFSLPKGKD